MVDPNTRQGKRTPVTLKIKFKSETLEQFIERYAVDVSQGGIFIRTKEPLAVGTQMRFEFQLRDASPLIAGEGTVVWTRENDPSRPAIAPGMGVRFDRLAEGSQGVLERILAEKAKQAPQRPPTETTKPPMFTDTPTRVAPAPVQDALLGSDPGTGPANTIKRKRPDSFTDEKGTPLPRPMPFHSDADDFDDQAFEEATKVRALDDLIAQTAPDAASAESSAPRRATGSSTPPINESANRDSAPVLPSPPETSRPNPKILDTTPSPRPASPSGSITLPSDTAASGAALPAVPPTGAQPIEQRTMLGMEPAKASMRTGSTTSPPAIAAAPASRELAPQNKPAARSATDPLGSRRPAKSGGGAGAAILVLLLIAAAVAGVWFFVLRDKATQRQELGLGSGSDVVTNPVAAGSGSSTMVAGSNEPGSGSATEVGSGSSGDVGSGSGSAALAAGSAGSGSGSAVAPTTALLETTITANADKATVEVLGMDQTGPLPYKAKLEKDKTYRARISAPGYASTEIDIKGGDAKAVAKLAGKPRTISVLSDPAGAAIFIDGAATGKTTPFDVELSKVQAAKKAVRVSIRKGGFKTVDRVLDLGKYTEGPAKLTAEISETLVVQAVVVRPPVVTPPAGSGSGSAAPPETGSAATPPPTPTEVPKDAAPAPTEPEPDFMNKPAP